MLRSKTLLCLGVLLVLPRSTALLGIPSQQSCGRISARMLTVLQPLPGKLI